MPQEGEDNHASSAVVQKEASNTDERSNPGNGNCSSEEHSLTEEAERSAGEAHAEENEDHCGESSPTCGNSSASGNSSIDKENYSPGEHYSARTESCSTDQQASQEKGVMYSADSAHFPDSEERPLHDETPSGPGIKSTGPPPVRGGRTKPVDMLKRWPFCCEVCHKRFRHKHDLYKHKVNLGHIDTNVSRHSERIVHLYYCEVCNEGFESKPSFLEHKMMLGHNTNVPRSKERNDEEVHNLHDLKAPEAGRADEYPNKPDEKNERCKKKSQSQSPKGGDPFACKDCDGCFHTKAQLEEHGCPNNGERRHFCEECQRSFKSRRNYRHHKNITHSTKRPFSCNVCGKGFKRIESLRKHSINLHSMERPHRCDTCGEHFQTVLDLKHHKVSHRLPLQCPSPCKQMFYYFHYMTKHMAISWNPKRFRCHYCGREFDRESHLGNHLVTQHLLAKESNSDTN